MHYSALSILDSHLLVLSQVANWRMEKLEVDSKSGSEEEFFDCLGEFSCFHSSPGSALSRNLLFMTNLSLSLLSFSFYFLP